MINSLTIKKVASYDDTGVNITDLKKVNFFFGFNGTGKSTIAKYIHNLSLPANQISNDYSHCSQTGYDRATHHILTFDEKFTEENFINNDNLKGVFSLNQTNELIDTQISDEETKITNLQKRLREKNALKDRLATDKIEKQKGLLDHCWSKRTAFTTFTKLNLPHGGSKPNHLSEIRGKLNNLPSIIPTIQQLKDNYDLLYEKELKEITTKVDAHLYKNIRKLEVKLQNLLQEVIIGNEDVDIARLINQINSRSWVETGIQFLSKTDICPFCQQETITTELKEQFEKFFDQSYKEKIEAIKLLKNEYITLTESFLSNILEIQNVFNPNNLVSTIYLTLQSLFNDNRAVIIEKLENANERKSISFLNQQKGSLSNILKKIIENNKSYADIDDNKKTLVSNIWIFIASQCKVKIEKFDNRLVKYSRLTSFANLLIENLTQEISDSRQTIETLRTQTINTRDAVDNINIILKNAGFDGFEIAEKNVINNISQYYLKRPQQSGDGAIFKSLSEGEKNFISFLYFHQLCIGTDDIQSNSSKKKIIVIDDPVSSLDSQALFVVSTLIHTLTTRKGNNTRAEKQGLKNDNLSQILILTHNLYFYKEVSFDKRPICTDYWHYKVSKLNNKSDIKGSYNKTVHDDYTLLWNTLKELKENLPETTTLNIVIANSMRRIIESYVNFIGYGKDSWSSLFNLDENEPTYYIKCAFISIINDESHKTTALDGVYYQKIINEQPQILFDVFKEIFRTIGKEHYEMMLDEEIN
ncbi:AAA family ATPase [Flavobacterium psychrophilum]